jgi:anti-sigma factor RsiW
MSLSQDTMLELMAYADGELDGEALVRTEALVQSNEEARRIVLAMGSLGDVVREGLDARPELVKADAIVHGVMRKINAEPTARMRKPRSSASIAPNERRFFGSSQTRVIGVIAGGLAMAAAAFFVLRSAPTDVTGDGTGAHATAASSITSPTPQAQHLDPGALAQETPGNGGANGATNGSPNSGTVGTGSGVDVEQVESPSHQVSVFYLPAVAAAAANSNASSVVVWIGDDNGGH